jgi:hypothetical protein
LFLRSSVYFVRGHARERISSSNVDLNVVPNDLHLIRRNPFLGRRMAMRARFKTEPAGVPGTLNLQAFDESVVQGGILVGADLVDGEAPIADTEEGQLLAAGIDADAKTLVKLGKTGHRHERHLPASDVFVY